MLKRLKQRLKNIGLVGAHYFLRTRFVAKSLPFKYPPILLLSYPRSGSSWIGMVLSASESVAYLREPITQPYLKEHGGKYALVDINNDKLAASIYRKLSNEAFSGLPSMHPQVVNNLRDFVFKRSRRHLLIKEVNPKAIRFYLTQYNPKVVLILRHPAAVALSFSQQGWLDSLDTQLDTGTPEANVWEKFGYAYGLSMKYALEVLKDYTDYEVIMYENLAECPKDQFKKIFELLTLEVPEDYEGVIQKYCYSRKSVQKASQTERVSSEMVYKWHKELSRQEILSVRKGFSLSALDYYSDAADWPFK